METIQAKTRAFLIRYIQDSNFQNDQDIFEMGFVNSLFAMQLVLFVESEFAISLDSDDLDIDNFRTVQAITDLVQRKTVATA
jgi:methoxymalonate biosynthesis acyl carrier protein